MTLKRQIVSTAQELMSLLESCADVDFVDEIANAVKYCDYALMDDLEQEAYNAETD